MRNGRRKRGAFYLIQSGKEPQTRGKPLVLGHFPSQSLLFKYKCHPPFTAQSLYVSSPSTVIRVPTCFLIIMELQFKHVFVGKEYQAAQDKKARDKARKAQGKMTNNKFPTIETSQQPSLSNRCSPLSDISRIPTPESRPTDSLLSSPKATDQDIDDEFPPIGRLLSSTSIGRSRLERPIEVLDLTGGDHPPGQPESPRRQPIAETDSHLQSTADILAQLGNLLIPPRQSPP